MNIYKQQKFTFKLTIGFSFLLVRVDDENFDTSRKGDDNNYIRVDFDLRLASTNTRPEDFKNPCNANIHCSLEHCNPCLILC
jgi:hypothetical protein